MWNEFPLVLSEKVDGILNLCVSFIALVCSFAIKTRTVELTHFFGLHHPAKRTHTS